MVTDCVLLSHSSVTTRSISADRVCVSLHLGADVIYAVRQGGGHRSRHSSGFSGFHMTSLIGQRRYVGYTITSHSMEPYVVYLHFPNLMKECKIQGEAGPPSAPEVLSVKPCFLICC